MPDFFAMKDRKKEADKVCQLPFLLKNKIEMFLMKSEEIVKNVHNLYKKVWFGSVSLV